MQLACGNGQLASSFSWKMPASLCAVPLPRSNLNHSFSSKSFKFVASSVSTSAVAGQTSERSGHDLLELLFQRLVYKWLDDHGRSCTCGIGDLHREQFASLGAVCRALVASVLAALQPLLSITRQDPHCYQLHGLQRFNGDALQCAVVLALSVWVSESFIHSVMDDDRVALHSGVYWAVCVEELGCLINRPASEWDCLVHIFQPEVVSTTHLRDATITSASWVVSSSMSLSSCGWCLGFSPWGSPWISLKHSMHYHWSKVWLLLSPPSSPTRTCYFVQTYAVRCAFLEKHFGPAHHLPHQHGSCVVMHKKHPSYELETLVQRIYLHASPSSSAEWAVLSEPPDQAETPKADHWRGDMCLSMIFLPRHSPYVQSQVRKGGDPPTKRKRGPDIEIWLSWVGLCLDHFPARPTKFPSWNHHGDWRTKVWRGGMLKLRSRKRATYTSACGGNPCVRGNLLSHRTKPDQRMTNLQLHRLLVETNVYEGWDAS